MPTRRAAAPPPASLLASAALARLVVHFVVHWGERTYFRHLQRAARLSIGSLQRELARLEHLGLIVREREGPHLFVQPNTKHPAWRGLRQLAALSTEPRDVLTSALAGIAGIDAAFIFGSVARGDARPDSDVDLMVIGTAIDERRLYAMTAEAGAFLGREVNVVRYTRAEFLRRLRAGQRFVSDVWSGPKQWVIGDEMALPGP